MAARGTGVPFVATYHGAYSAKTPLKRLYNSAMARGDVVIANSEYTARAIRAQFAVDEKKLRVIPRGVDLRLFDPENISGERVAALARDWGVEQGRPSTLRLLLPGRLTSWKGHGVAIEAIAAIASSGQKLDLQLALPGDAQGRDDYRDALQRAIDMRGVRDMIHLVGHCADMPAAYAWADAVIAPSTRPEAFGRVPVEAGAMGKPIIATAHGGAQETVIEGDTGLLVAPGEAEALAGAIARLAAMGPEGRRAMGARARERVRRVYSLEGMQRATLEAYQSLGA